MWKPYDKMKIFLGGRGERGEMRERPEKIHCKKRFAIFPSPAGMSLTKLSHARNNLTISRPGRVWLTLFYTRGLGIVVSHVMVPLPYRFSL
jgi:hypothetical protein